MPYSEDMNMMKRVTVALSILAAGVAVAPAPASADFVWNGKRPAPAVKPRTPGTANCFVVFHTDTIKVQKCLNGEYRIFVLGADGIWRRVY